ncbi:MAG TPA: ABC transporter ATP-binding protein [Gaiellaceae bacterium]|jgi:ABC-2 type transport system ATP-binding protein
MVEVKALTKTYPGGVEAVRGVSFTVEAGEVFGLLGPNGAGKSTTIGMLTTTLMPTAGAAVLAGHDVAAEPLAARRISSVVFQEPVVDRSFTGRRNLELHGRLWGVGAKATAERIERVSETLGIAGLLDRAVAGYSGGERRRLEIARALISSPRVLFLDEPTVGLDPRIRHELLDAIDALRRRDELTVLLTTHYLDEAERLCDRIAVMHAGRIVALGSPGELRARLGDELLELQVARDAEAALDVLQARGVADEDAFAVGATVIVPLRSTAPEAIVAARETGLAITAVATRAPTLDDVYLRLTGGRLAA